MAPITYAPCILPHTIAECSDARLRKSLAGTEDEARITILDARLEVMLDSAGSAVEPMKATSTGMSSQPNAKGVCCLQGP